MIAVLNLILVLDPRFVLLEGLPMNRTKIINSLFDLRFSSWQMSADKAYGSLLNRYPNSNSSFITKLPTHTSFYGIFMNRLQRIFPFFIDVNYHKKSHHLNLLNVNVVALAFLSNNFRKMFFPNTRNLRLLL